MNAPTGWAPALAAGWTEQQLRLAAKLSMLAGRRDRCLAEGANADAKIHTARYNRTVRKLRSIGVSEQAALSIAARVERGGAHPSTQPARQVAQQESTGAAEGRTLAPGERAEVTVRAGYNDVRDRASLYPSLVRRFGEGVQVERVTPATDGRTTIGVVAGSPDPLRGAVKRKLPAGVKSTAANEYSQSLAREGLALLRWAPEQGYLVAGRVPPWDTTIRERIAGHLRCSPWDVELASCWTVDANSGTGRLDAVEVLRAPMFQTAEKRISAWTEAIQLLPGGSAGWKIGDDPQRGRIILRWGAPIVVPDRVPLEEMPAVMDPVEQWRLPLGVDGRGRPVAWDLTETPHMLVVGTTGSGKTIALTAVISAALVRGFELGIVECTPVKHGLDFEPLRPYVKDGYWGCDSVMHACRTIEQAYSLANGRLAQIRRARPEGQEQARSLHDLTRAEQDAIGVHPMLLVIDEAALIFRHPETASLRYLAPDDPDRIAQEAETAARAKAGDRVKHIAAELRSVGIHLVCATQRYTAAEMELAGGNDLKINLGSRLALGTLSPDNLRLSVVNADAAEWAYSIAHGENPRDMNPDEVQKHPGRAVFETPTQVRPMQAVYAPEPEWIRRLEAAGVPRPGGAAPTLDAEISREPEDGAVLTINSTLDLTLDELEDGLEPDTAADEASVTAEPTGGITETPVGHTDLAADVDPGDEWM